MTLDPKLTDKRIVRRMLATGALDAAEYQRLLQELPDLSDKVPRLGDHAREARDEGMGREP